jgi:SHS2 domain-containing protein
MTGIYKFIDHTADIAFEAEGDTLEELFIASAKAWKDSVLEKEQRLKAGEQLKIELVALTIEQLLVDFLSELNFLLFTKRWLYLTTDKISIVSENRSWKLSATVGGNIISQDVPLKEEIKAVTYHQMEIVNKNNKYKTRVVFDI